MTTCNYLCVLVVLVALSAVSPSEAAIPTQMAAPVLKEACSTSLTIAWAEAASSTGSAEYKLERDDGAGGAWESTAAYEGTALESTVTGLTAAKTYKFRITAKNTDGSGPVSDVLEAKTPAAAVPSKPAAPLVVDSCADTMTLEWEKPTSGCPTGYKLEIDAGDNVQAISWDGTKTYTGANLKHEFTGLTAAKMYRIKLTATNAAGDSEASEIVYQSTRTATDKPSKPAAPVLQSFDIKPARTHSDTTTGTMTIRWEKGNRCGTTSKLEMDDGAGGAFTQIYEGTAFEWLQGGLDSTKTYKFRVSHKNAAGYGDVSDLLEQKFPKLYHLVSDFKNDRVLRFDSVTGDFVDEFIQKGSGGLHHPWGVAIGPGGDIFVSSENPPAVLRYDGKTGKFKSKFCDVPGSPRDLVFGPAWNWPANTMPNVGSEIKAKCPSTGRGNGAIQWPQFGTKPAECPNGRVARYMIENQQPYMNSCCLGHLYVTSHYNDAVLKFNGVTGAPLGTFVSGVDTPVGLFFDADGHLRVSSEHGDGVYKFNGVTGAFMREFTNKKINYANGIDSKVADGKGHLYGTGPYSGKVIVKFDWSTGNYIEHFQDDDSSYPVGLVQYDSKLYVTNKHTIRRYNADTGEFIDVFSTKDGMFATFMTFHWM